MQTAKLKNVMEIITFNTVPNVLLKGDSKLEGSEIGISCIQNGKNHFSTQTSILTLSIIKGYF